MVLSLVRFPSVSFDMAMRILRIFAVSTCTVLTICTQETWDAVLVISLLGGCSGFGMVVQAARIWGASH